MNEPKQTGMYSLRRFEQGQDQENKQSAANEGKVIAVKTEEVTKPETEKEDVKSEQKEEVVQVIDEKPSEENQSEIAQPQPQQPTFDKEQIAMMTAAVANLTNKFSSLGESFGSKLQKMEQQHAEIEKRLLEVEQQ